jgi:acyl-coenzyme A thioesterase PaaI-like protein
MEQEVAYYSNCFVCGPKNPVGLKLRFVNEGGVTRTGYTALAEHEGYKQIAHGGILATILDEVMIKSALAENIFCLTAQMEIRFKRPVAVGTELFFEGEIVQRRGRVTKTSGLARDADGNVYAEASGTYITADPEMKTQLLESLEE